MASTYLTRTPSSSGNRKTWTYSAWIKLGSTATMQLFSAGVDSSNYNSLRITQTGLRATNYNSSDTWNIRTNALLRDTNAWYHIVLRVDTTQSTSSDRVRLYINGELQTSLLESSYPAQNQDEYVNNTNLHAIGTTVPVNSNNFNGSMSHIHLCDGYSYAPTEFGETDSTTGEWKINTSPSVSYGTNGFFILKDGNSVTDSSSNSNAFTVASGTLTKTEDCPSNVFATWNPLHHSTQSFSNVTLKNGNTTFDNDETGSTVYPQGYSTLAASSGKYYFESKLIASSSDASMIGISGAVTTEAYVGNDAYTYVFRSNGTTRNNDNSAGTYTGWGVGDIVQVAVDLDNNKLYFGINGTWQNSGDPTSGSTGTGAIFTITAPSNTPHGVYHFTLGDTSSAGSFEHATNFGNGYFGTTAVSSAGTNASGIGIFEYDVPTGYTALSTKGLNL